MGGRVRLTAPEKPQRTLRPPPPSPRRRRSSAGTHRLRRAQGLVSGSIRHRTSTTAPVPATTATPSEANTSPNQTQKHADTALLVAPAAVPPRALRLQGHRPS